MSVTVGVRVSVGVSVRVSFGLDALLSETHIHERICWVFV